MFVLGIIIGGICICISLCLLIGDRSEDGITPVLLHTVGLIITIGFMYMHISNRIKNTCMRTLVIDEKVELIINKPNNITYALIDTTVANTFKYLVDIYE